MEEEEQTRVRMSSQEEPGGAKRSKALEEEHQPKRLRIEDCDDMDTIDSVQGDILNLTKGWDFEQLEQREKVLKLIDQSKPKLIIGSVMRHGEDGTSWKESRRHTLFMAQLYRSQIARGAWYLHDQPTSATTACRREVSEHMPHAASLHVPADQCAFGVHAWNQSGRARTSASFITNSGEIRDRLRRSPLVLRQVSHVGPDQRSWSVPRQPRYGSDMLRAVQSGLAQEFQLQVGSLRKLVEVVSTTQMSMHAPEEEESESNWQMAWDDVTGQELNPADVRKARAKEMQYVVDKQVWKVVPRAMAQQNGWKVIPTRWIDVNKGDSQQPNYRSRLVAKEFNTGEQDGLFAATPPLEAVRLLISDAATIEDAVDGSPRAHTARPGAPLSSGASGKVIMVNDVARAFFEAPVKRTVCVELPREALQGGGVDEDSVGLLQMSLYGTRDAAANFQAEVRKFMESCGFVQSRYSPSVYYHKERGLRTLVHGDDFMTTGRRDHADWFKRRLEARFEIKTKIIGLGEGEVAEERLLGRIIRATPGGGWEYEADQRHAELIIKGMNLVGANGVKSPGEDDKPWEAETDDEELRGSDVTAYRALAARANYLALDRADIQFAAKEICRGMARPARGHLKRLRRLARYLITVPRVVWHFAPQCPVSIVTAYSDSDWAGCRRTARSTSGGVLMRGSHCLRTYSVTQKFVTLSSGEAELMALVKATSEAIGMTQLAQGWGLSMIGSVLVDSSAALAVTARKGNGKLRHVRIGHLWVQELAERDEVRFAKVRGTENPADLLTKHLTGKRIQALSKDLRQVATTGQAQRRLALDNLGRSPGGAAPGSEGGVSEFRQECLPL